MKPNETEKKVIRKLVSLYFDCNPHMNRGIAFKTKTWDIISAYYLKHKKTEEEIKQCIESSPMCDKPIWTQFFDYFYKKPFKAEQEKKKQNNITPYKKSISKSSNPDDWM